MQREQQTVPEPWSLSVTTGACSPQGRGISQHLTSTVIFPVNFTFCLAAVETWQASAEWLAVPCLIMRVKAIGNSFTIPLAESRIYLQSLRWPLMIQAGRSWKGEDLWYPLKLLLVYFFFYTLLDIELKWPLIWDTSAAHTTPFTLQRLCGLISTNNNFFGCLVTYMIPFFVFTSVISPTIFLYEENAVKLIS